MKIKRVLHFVLMLCLLSCMLALSACNDNKTTTTSTSSTAPHTHTFASTLSFDASGHWFSASCEHTSEKKNFAPHTFDEGTLTTVPTNEKGGTMTYVCTECGYEKEEFVQPTGNHVHSFNITVVAPTCTEFGYTAYTCSCSFTYQSDEVAPKGHRYAEVLSYDGGHHYYAATCGCDEYKEYAAHEFAHNTVLPTCEVNGYTEHTCKCGYSYVSDSVLATGHKTESFSHSEPSLLDASSCLYAVTHTGSCSVCGTVTASTETLECHSLFERIIEAATCAKDGTVGVFCANKDCRYHDSAKSTTSYADLTAHDYVKNDALSTPTLSVYVCSASDCHATLHETTGTSAEIPKEDLQNATEITFSDASLLLDEKIRETFEGKDISISAAELSGSEIANAFLQTNLTQEQVDLLNGGRVFNFTLTADTAVSALGGTATVRIPYTLAQGDDPTSLIVWHFANGELKPFEATYGEDADGNGYVTFSTTHFSYYTVTYATRGRICERFGHLAYKTVLPTCTEDGYSLCGRCGERYTTDNLLSHGHNLTSTILTAPTCETEGKLHIACSDCTLAYDAVILANGHALVHTDGCSPTCASMGYSKGVCAYCGKAFVNTLPSLPHDYKTTVIAPTCAEGGYTVRTCARCGDTHRLDVTAPVGHTADTAFYANETYHYHLCVDCGTTLDAQKHVSGGAATEQSAELCTVCAYVITPPVGHTHTLTLVQGAAPSCTESGTLAYYTCECGARFADEQGKIAITSDKDIYLAPLGHKKEAISGIAASCKAEGRSAGIRCSVCETVLSGCATLPITDHSYTAQITPATCETNGRVIYVCLFCEQEDADAAYTIPALGHKTVNSVLAPTCDAGGYTVRTCLNCHRRETVDYTDALGHAFAVTYTATEDGHYHECSRCDSTTELEAHIPNRKAPTNTHSVNCSLCDYEITPALNHTHSVKTTVSQKDPSCAKTGNTAYYICACGDWFADAQCTVFIANHASVIIPALGHIETYVDGTESTCGTHGYTAGIYCERCEKWLSGHEKLPLKAHVWGEAISLQNGMHRFVCLHDASHTRQEACIYTSVVTAPTCTEQGYTTYTCSVCSHSYKADYENETGHSYAYTENGDGTHTFVCQNDPSHRGTAACSYTSKVTAPTCTEKGYTTYTCLVCGHSHKGNYQDELGHRFTKAGYDQNSHYKYCSVCSVKDPDSIEGHRMTATVIAPTCEQGGYTIQRCADCDYTYTDTPTPPLKHSYSYSCHENGTHTKICANDPSHKSTEPCTLTSVVTAPTCTEQGYTTHTCSVCKHSYKNSYKDATGHNYTYSYLDGNKHSFVCKNDASHTGTALCEEYTVVTPPTCISEGYTTHICNLCKHSYQDTFTPKADHTYSKKVTPPTCTEQGFTTYTCHCGDTYKGDYRDAPGHRYESVATAPTCTEKGYTTYTCHCGDTYKGDYRDAPGHRYESVTTAPTCTSEGYTTYTCHCGNTYTDDYVAKLGHEYSITSFDSEHHFLLCKHCQEKDGSSTTAHSMTETVIAPTCEADGYTLHSCAGCEYRYTDNRTSAIGHAYSYANNGDGTHTKICANNPAHNRTEACTFKHTVTAPTCTENGYTTHICTLCEYTYQDGDKDATGHRYKYENVSDGMHSFICQNDASHSGTEACTLTSRVTAPTCTSEGYTTHTCAVCKHSFKDSYTDKVEHEYVASVTDPTCTSEGYTTYTCLGCDDTYVDNFTPKADHLHRKGETVPPTCTEMGYTVYTCKCGDIYHDDFVSELGHSFTKLSYNEMQHFMLCELCDAVDEMSYEKHALETTVKEPTCETDGYTLRVCDCGYSEKTVEKATGHKHETSVTEPTCTEKGYTTYVCHCGDTYKGNYKNPYGHSYDENGVCIRCGDRKVAYRVTLEGIAMNGTMMTVEYILYVNKDADVIPDSATALAGVYVKEENSLFVYLDGVLHVVIRIGEDETYLRYACDKGEHTLEVIERDATCTAAGTSRVLCTKCGHEESYAETPMLPHTFSEDFEYNEEGHYHYCVLCGEKDSVVFAHEDNDKNGYCDDCGVQVGMASNIAYAYDQITPDGSAVRYEFYVDGAYLIKLDDFEMRGYWACSEGLLKFYSDAALTDHMGSFYFVDDKVIEIYQCANEESHNYIILEEVEQTCGQDGYIKYKCTLCAGGHKLGAPATGNHSDKDGNGICDICGSVTEAPERDIEQVRAQALEYVESTFISLRERYGDLGDYEQGYLTHYEGIMYADAIWIIEGYLEKFQMLVDRINDQYGASDIENLRNQTVSYMMDQMMYLEKTYGALSELVWQEYNHYCNLVMQAQSEKEIDTCFSGFCIWFEELEYQISQGCPHYGSYEVNRTESTCQTHGYVEYYCPDCGKTTNEPLPLANHNDYDGDGCCDICGQGTEEPELETLRQQVLEVMSNAWKELEAECALTQEQQNRYKQLRSSVKKAPDIGSIDKYHSEFISLVEEIRNGYMGECMHNNRVLENEYPSTCTQIGYLEYLCHDCGKTFEVELPFADHDDSDGDTCCDYCSQNMFDLLREKIYRQMKDHMNSLVEKYGYFDAEDNIAFDEQYLHRVWEMQTEEELYDLLNRFYAFANEIEQKLSMRCKHEKRMEVYRQASTCVVSGFVEYRCEECNEAFSEPLPLAPHEDWDGNGKCDLCYAPIEADFEQIRMQALDRMKQRIYKFQEQHFDMPEHLWKEYEICADGIDQACMEQNVEAIYAFCDKFLKAVDDYEKEIMGGCAHDNYVLIGEYPSSCAQVGYLEYLCHDCGNTFQTELPFADHNDSDGDGYCDSCSTDMFSIKRDRVYEEMINRMTELEKMYGIIEPMYWDIFYMEYANRVMDVYSEDELSELLTRFYEFASDLEKMLNERCRHEKRVEQYRLPSTCVVQGFIDYICEDCGATFIEMLPLADEHMDEGNDSICDRCSAQIGGFDSDIGILREQSLSRMLKMWESLNQQYALTYDQVMRYHNIRKQIEQAQSREEILFLYEQDFRMLVQEIECGPKDECMYVGIDAFLDLPMHSSMEALYALLASSSLRLDFSQSGSVYLPIDPYTLDLSMVNLSQVGTYEVSIPYGHTTELGGYAFGDVVVSIRVLPPDYDKGTLYHLEGITPTDWDEGTLFESGYIELLGFFYPLTPYKGFSNVYSFYEGHTALIMHFDPATLVMSFYRPEKGGVIYYVDDANGMSITYEVVDEYLDGLPVAIVTATQFDETGMMIQMTFTTTVSIQGDTFVCSVTGKYTIVDGNRLVAWQCPHNGEVAEKFVESTCQQAGFREVDCALCGKVLLYESFPTADHCYENGYCIYCGTSDGAFADLVAIKEENIRKAQDEWASILCNYAVSQKRYEQFNMLIEQMEKAISYEEVQSIHSMLFEFFEEVRKEVGMGGKDEYSVRYPIVPNTVYEGMGLDAFLYTHLIGKYVEIVLSTGEVITVELQSYNVSASGSLNHVGDEAWIHIQNAEGDPYFFATDYYVTVTTNMENAKVLGCYQLSYDILIMLGLDDETIILFDNGYARIGDAYFAYSYFNISCIRCAIWGADIFIELDVAKQTADNFIPAYKVLDVYTLVKDEIEYVFHVYDMRTENGTYLTYVQMRYPMSPEYVKFTTDVTLEKENAYFSHAMLGSYTITEGNVLVSFDGSNNDEQAGEVFYFIDVVHASTGWKSMTLCEGFANIGGEQIPYRYVDDSATLIALYYEETSILLSLDYASMEAAFADAWPANPYATFYLLNEDGTSTAFEVYDVQYESRYVALVHNYKSCPIAISMLVYLEFSICEFIFDGIMYTFGADYVLFPM